MVQWDSYINAHEQLGSNFQRHHIRNVWRGTGDGHHYDVTSYYGVALTTSLVEWTLTSSEINVVICSFEELLDF